MTPTKPEKLWRRVKPDASNAPPSGSDDSPNYRIRALLYAGKPNRTLLNTITPRLYPKSHETLHLSQSGS